MTVVLLVSLSTKVKRVPSNKTCPFKKEGLAGLLSDCGRNEWVPGTFLTF